MDYGKLCEEVVIIARETGSYIRGYLNQIADNQIEKKGKQNFVTFVDKGAEERIVKSLIPLLPEAGFITEEGTTAKSGETYTWVIDPLDGTTNFIHGAPPVSVSIALLESNIPVLGVVYELFLDECFYAWEGSKAYLNGNEIKVSSVEKTADALIATGFPFHNFDRIETYMESLKYFFTHSHGVRRIGSAAADLSYVACGRYDAFYEYNLNPWDVAAGALIIQQAGGRVSDFKGNPGFLFNREIVASNAKVFQDFLSHVGRFMNITQTES